MSHFDLLLLSAGATFLAAVVFGRQRHAGWLMTAAYALQLVLLITLDPTAAAVSALRFELLGVPVGWRLDALGWFFALITIGAALLSSWYSAGEWQAGWRESGGRPQTLHLALAVNVLSMLLLLAADDLLALFIGWELVSWAGLLLMLPGGREAVAAGVRYITYATGGGMAVFAGLILVYTWTGSLDVAAVAAAIPGLSGGQLWTLALLFAAGFGVKLGLLPFHLWQAPAYAFSPGPAAAFLGAISSRMGLFAIAAVLVKLIGIGRLAGLELWPNVFDARDLLLWVSAFTIILPTFTALKQNDARLLLTWHGIGQGGYMLLGLLLGDAMGTAGGLLHAFNYATYQAALLMVVFAVIHRTGTANLNRLGGLVTRMPLSFLAMLIGIIGLAGLPPMNGFVSKWMIYRALITEGMPLLFLATVIGTLGTILSVYKLLHNTFLGQLRIEHEHVKEAPWSMTVPMLILCAVVFLTGFMPGLALKYVALAQQAVDLPAVDYILGGVAYEAGSLDMIFVSSVLFGGFAVGAVLFYGAGPSRRVHQLDNYAGGHFLTADVRYQYSDNFYAGLMHRIGPWYRNSFYWAERAVSSAVDTAGVAMQGFYRQLQPAVWVLVSVTLAMAWVIL